MSIIATIELPAGELGLAETFDALPGLSLRAEPVVAGGGDAVLNLWADCDDPEALSMALEDDESVVAAETIDAAGTRRLYRIKWRDESALLDPLERPRTALLEARGSGGRWTFRFRFAEREALSAAIERYERDDRSFTLRRIHENDSTPDAAGLTDCQYEAVELALEGGYYEVPRRDDLCALAERVGVSHQALSERLRRAHGTLAEDAVDVRP